MPSRLLTVVAAAFATAVLLAAGAAGAEPARAPQAVTYTIRSVTDGDTIRLTNGKRVRLVQIDAPEVQENECYGRQAKDALVSILAPGTRVRLASDPALDKVDRYGRLLRYIFKGSLNVNIALVKRGAATVWFYEGGQGRYATRLLNEATAARDAGRGLWGACLDTPFDPSQGADTGPAHPPATAACSDGQDNDADGLTDYPADPGCGSASDTDERNQACANGLDDDGDGAADFPNDPGCASAGDDQETTPLYQCDDGGDNDSDGKTDYPDDPDCTSPSDTSEAASTSPPSNCDPAYPTVCIPPPPPDLDCADVAYTNFTVLAADPHRFDGDSDGIGCET